MYNQTQINAPFNRVHHALMKSLQKCENIIKKAVKFIYKYFNY